MTCDIPNAFIQADMPTTRAGEDRVIMRITGVLVDMLVQIDAELYGPFVVYEKNRKVLYVVVIKAIYGMLVADSGTTSSARNWKKLDLSSIRTIHASQIDKCKGHNDTFHVDDVKSSHKQAKVNDDFAIWLQEMYGEHAEVKCHRGDRHVYLGMVFDYSRKGKFKIDMTEYITNMVDDFPIKLK
jgi:hypothetical protein